MDRLSAVINRFPISAHFVYAGELCGTSDFSASEGSGHLHILRRGKLTLTCESGQPIIIDRPALLLFPKPMRHRLFAQDNVSAEVVCASVQFGTTPNNPFLKAFPDLLNIPLDSSPSLQSALELLFEEAFGQRCGRQTAVNRLTEYCLLLTLRHIIARKVVDSGVLSGLSDPRIAKAITALHDHPGRAWTLVSLAEAAGMSRARFAAQFRQTVGKTPLEYLTDWRLGVAQSLIKQGKPLKFIAVDVGYASAATFSRVFVERVGLTPKEWLQQVQAGN